MKKILAASGLIALVFGFLPVALAGGDKVLACHITGMNLDGDRYQGHVISISPKALGAHCNHNRGVSDHHPQGVINNAIDACVGDSSDNCVTKNSIGKTCSRAMGNQGAIDNLCDQ